MTILITASGKINEKFIANIENALQDFMNPTGCTPQVTLFLDVDSMNDSEVNAVAKAVGNGKIEYRFGIYGKADKDTTEDWRRVISDNRHRLEDRLHEYDTINANVDTFRAKDFLWTNHMFAALDQLDIKEDFSYVTAQPLWPFTFPYGSALCDSKASLQNNGMTRLCPGRFDDLWEIPNNMLFAEYNSEIFNCTWLGDCLNLSRSQNQTLVDFLNTNYKFRSAANSFFHNYWQSREPFVLNLESDFFEKVFAVYKNGSDREVHKALSMMFALFAKEDSYYVSASQLVHWMKNKQPTFDVISSSFYEGKIFECKMKYSSFELAGILVPFSSMLLYLLALLVGFGIVASYIFNLKEKSFTYKTFMSIVMSTDFKVTLMPIGSCLTTEKFLRQIDKLRSKQSNKTIPKQNTATADISQPKKTRVSIKYLVVPLFAVLKFLYWTVLFYGPARLLRSVGKDNATETIQGYLFFYLDVIQTAAVAIFFGVSVIVSCCIICSLRRLKETIDELEESSNKMKTALYKPMSVLKLWVGLLATIIIVIIIVTYVVILGISISMRSNVGWYSTFNSETAWMYASFYAQFYVMAVMTVVYTYSLELWAQAAIIIFDVDDTKASAKEDNAEESLLGTLKSEYRKSYSGRMLSPLLLAPVQAFCGSRLVTHFAMYMQETLRYTDTMGRLFRISLIITIMIMSYVPYVATLLTHKRVNNAYKEHIERKKSMVSKKDAESQKSTVSKKYAESQTSTVSLKDAESQQLTVSKKDVESQTSTVGKKDAESPTADHAHSGNHNNLTDNIYKEYDIIEHSEELAIKNQDGKSFFHSPQSYFSNAMFILTAAINIIEVIINYTVRN
ncbi:uncharacterized protein LOC134190991 [Corticium candelabrum]|uniref:uncharacterized protein LOC134190991 n=1 Tax=Corticium candelabrum TaxID=121492 RepID=UPI002E26B14B|nr:uncharacterized protein LOC134190991 [Corticium candelabrum]